jgi:hypothetical protein
VRSQKAGGGVREDDVRPGGEGSKREDSGMHDLSSLQQAL